MALKCVTFSNLKNLHYKRFINSCKKNNIEPHVLGLQYKNFHFDLKILELLNFLSNLNKNDIILFTDCWDVIFLEGEKEIINKFKLFNKPLIFSAEKNFFCIQPNLSKNDFYSSTFYPFLNSGGFIGYNNYILQILKEIKNNKFYNLTDDQSIYYCYWKENKDKIYLDHNQEIFGTNSRYIPKKTIFKIIYFILIKILGKRFTIWNEFYIDKDNKLVNSITNTKPLIFHCPGKRFLSLDYIAYKKNYTNFLFRAIFAGFFVKIVLKLIPITLCYILFKLSYSLFIIYILLLISYHKNIMKFYKNYFEFPLIKFIY